MLYSAFGKTINVTKRSQQVICYQYRRVSLGATPRSELQLSATRSGTEEARCKSRRHLLSLQERFEDERVHTRHWARGRQRRRPAHSYETDFAARNCDVDSRNTWYKESVRSQRHKLAATAIGYFRMVAR
jgi:hypothetical protein